MKRLVALLMAASLSLSLAACGGSEAGDGQKGAASSPDPSASTPPAASSAVASSAVVSSPAQSEPVTEPEPAPEPQIEALAMGTLYTTTDFEITFNEVYMTKECRVQTGPNSSRLRKASEGCTFVVLDSSVKNIATSAISPSTDTLYNAYVMYNDKYKYEATSAIAFVGEDDIAPLATKTQCLAIEIPDEVANAAEPLVMYATVGGTTYQYAIR